MRRKLAVTSALAMLLVLCSIEMHAKIHERNRYVKMVERNPQAVVYNDEFVAFPQDLDDPNTTSEFFDPKVPFWLLAVEVDVVVRQADGRIIVKSDDDAYARLVHHCNFIYLGSAKRGQLPYGTGSELTRFALPGPYAYKIEGGHIRPINWHFHNQGGVPPEEDVYLRFKLVGDDENAGYIDTNAHWYQTELRESEFCIPPGPFTFPNSFRWPMLHNFDVVAAVAHVHDHATVLRLMVNDEVLWDYQVPRQDAYGYHTSHSTPCSRHAWHRHENHIKAKTLEGWKPEKPVRLNRGDRLWVYTEYFNDHDTDIDGMAIVAVFSIRQ